MEAERKLFFKLSWFSSLKAHSRDGICDCDLLLLPMDHEVTGDAVTVAP